MLLSSFTKKAKKQPHSVAKICNMDDREPITKLLEIHFLELQKFKKKKISEMSRAEKWLAYFSGKLTKMDEDVMQHDQILGKAINIRNEFMKDPDNYAAYLNREMEILDYKSMMQQKFEEGEVKGRNEGREEGREETTVRHLTNLIKNKKFSVEEALITLEIPEEQWESLKEKLK